MKGKTASSSAPQWVRVSSSEGDIWEHSKVGDFLAGEILSFAWRQKSEKEYKRNPMRGTHFPVCEIVQADTGAIYSLRFDLIKLDKLGTFPIGSQVRITFQGEKPIPGSKPMKLYDIDTLGKVEQGENWKDTTPMPRKTAKAKSKKGKR